MQINALPFSTYSRKTPIQHKNTIPTELRTIGDHIKKARIERGMTKASFANIFNVREDTMAHWERGDSPHAKYYPRIAEFLGYTPFMEEWSSTGAD